MGAKKIKLFSFSILILFCCLLSGTACGKEKENNEESVPDYEYEYTSKTVRIEEAEAIFMASLQDVVICHREHANYYFDKDLSPELRNHYVKTSEQVVQFLVDNAGLAVNLRYMRRMGCITIIRKTTNARLDQNMREHLSRQRF